MIRARLFQTVLLKPLCGGGGGDEPRHSREVETKSSFVPAGVQVENPAAASAPLPRSPRARPQRSGSRGSPGAAGSAGSGLSRPGGSGPSTGPGRAGPQLPGRLGEQREARDAPWRRPSAFGPGPNPDRTLRLGTPRRRVSRLAAPKGHTCAGRRSRASLSIVTHPCGRPFQCAFY